SGAGVSSISGWPHHRAVRVASAPVTERPHRSCLSVPGSSPKMLAKATGLAADEVFVDLEDSVAPGQKEEARAAAVEALGRGGFAAPHVGVRINAVTSEWWEGDVAAVAGAGVRVDFVTVPKVEHASEVGRVDAALRASEHPGQRTGVQVLIETAVGLS